MYEQWKHYKCSTVRTQKKRTFSPPPHSYRNSRNYLSVLALPLLFVTLFSACPVYDQPYFEFPLKTPVPTNIQIEGEYVPEEGEKLPVLLYYLDDTYDYGFVNDAGEVILENKDIVNRQGKIFYRLYLRDMESSILLGRRFDDNPIRFKLDSQGKLQFRDKRANPGDNNELYTPIDTMEEFLLMNGDSTLWGGAYLLTNELDMLGSPSMRAPRINWAPIGMSTSSSPPAAKFTGRFDGGGKKLWNLYIDTTTLVGNRYNIGLFGYIGGAKLRNIILKSGSVQGYENVGGIAGRAANGSEISGCSNAAEVTATTSYAGGVAGYNDGSITACSNAGSVTTVYGAAGGVAAFNNVGTITACSNAGSVTTTGYAANTGGVAGNNHIGGTITACSNTGAVTANGTIASAGGVAGWINNGTITACSNAGSVTTTGNASYAGGVAGNNLYSGSITACYNTGAVTATNSNSIVGGVAGTVASLASITACYWLDIPSDNADTGVGNPADDNEAAPFNGTGSWPDLSGDWSDCQQYWKSAGQWSEPPTDGNKSEFPKLYWQP